MPRQRKSARLWLRPERRGTDGSVRRAAWIIVDGGRHIATGCAASEGVLAEQKLAAYIASKYTPHRNERDLEDIPVADVLSIYLDDAPPRSEADRRELGQRVLRLSKFWADRTLAVVTGETCRRYVARRGRTGGARRDLEVLRAAINHHAEQGFHRAVVKVWLPEKGQPRDRWLTRSEAARLLWTCWRARETQTVHVGPEKGRAVETKRRPLRHLCRFILIGLYTGTRAGAIASASLFRADGRSYVDLDAGVFYRLAEGRQATNKRQPPARLPGRLLAHMRRWKAADAAWASAKPGRVLPTHVVHWHGRPVVSVKTAFGRAVELAGLPGKVSPHTLRHSAVTWLMQAGVSAWEAAGLVGMSVQMVDRVYGHHDPDHLRDAANRVGYRAASRQKLAGSLAGEKRMAVG